MRLSCRMQRSAEFVASSFLFVGVSWLTQVDHSAAVWLASCSAMPAALELARNCVQTQLACDRLVTESGAGCNSNSDDDDDGLSCTQARCASQSVSLELKRLN